PKIPRSRTLPAGCPIPEKGAGRSEPQSTQPCPFLYFRPRSTNASARVAKRVSATSCSPRCATNSAATWRKARVERGARVNAGRVTGGRRVKIEVYPDDDAVARKAAAIIADAARAAVTSRGRFIMAVSGGRTPWLMLRALADDKQVHVFQVDERVAPADNPDRNLAHLRASLLDHAPPAPDHIHAMPVEAANLDRAAEQCASTLRD